MLRFDPVNNNNYTTQKVSRGIQMAANRFFTGILPLALLLGGCNVADNSAEPNKPFAFLKKLESSNSDTTAQISEENTKSLAEILNNGNSSLDMKNGFAKAIASAVIADPLIISAKEDLAAQRSQVEVAQSAKDIQFNATALGGVEDVSDDISGVALVLNATRVISDGGKIDSRVASEKFAAEGAKYRLQATMNERALSAVYAWVDLDRYEKLNDMIGSRLLILNPLIEQLETVAAAGMGDASQVAAAQRTVSQIRFTQTDIKERLEQSRVAFRSVFGTLPSGTKFDGSFIESKLPTKVTKSIALSAPALLAAYASYNVAEANLSGVQAKSKFDLGFETKVTKPFGGSDYSSDESIGLVLRKAFFNSKQLEAEEKAAKSRVDSAIAQIQSTYREGEKTINTAQQTVKSMDEAIALARETAKVTRDEISYLRKQLIIGGSTLDSVLSAEARLYDAESKEIHFEADKVKAQVTVLSALGLLSQSFGLSAE